MPLSLLSSEADELFKLAKKINDYDDAGAFNLILSGAQKLYDLASRSSSDSLKTEYRCKALTFKMDRYKYIDNNLFELTFHEYEKEIKLNAGKDYSLLFNYYIYKSDYLFLKSNYEGIPDLLKQAEELLIRIEPNNKNLDFIWRKMMVCRRRGDFYMKESNYRLAQNQYELALSAARETDRLLIKQGKYWGYECYQLINLFTVAVFSEDSTSINAIYSKLLNKKKSVYDNRWDLVLIQTLLKDKIKTPHQINSITNQLTSNELIAKDPEILIEMSKYFLDSNYFAQSAKFKNRVLALRPFFVNNLSINVKFNMLLADFALNECNFSSMDSLITVSIDLLLEDQIGFKNPKINGSRKDYLTFLQAATGLYAEAYTITRQKYFLFQCSNLTDKAIYTLNLLRLKLPDESDRTLLLKQLTDLCKNALNNYAELFKEEKLNSYQATILLNYFEANKSFNLHLNREIKQSLSASDQSTLNRLDEEWNGLNQQVSLSVNQSDSAIYLKSIITDSTSVMWEKALRQSRIEPLINLEQIQNKLQKDQSIIEYFNSSHCTYAIIINKGMIKFKRLLLPEKDSLSLNDLLLTAGFYINDNQDYKLYSRIAFQLYDFLVKPLFPYLEKRVIIIPEANMSTMPWASLLTEKTTSLNCKYWPYWIKTHTIATQHSLSLWLADEKFKDNPSYSHADIPFSGFAPNFENLDYNIIECKEIRTLMSGDTFLNRAANLENFKAYASKSRILHISSHAQANPEDPDSSYIKLKDHTLYSGEIKQISIPSDLVFLSACETGIGQVIHSEGVMSLARSFFASGARSVISTLWKVNDKSTLDQVKAIYENLLLGESKDEAIRSMQLDYLEKVQNPEKAFPYYWAAYQCQGDLKPLFKKRTMSTLALMTFLPLFIFIFIGISTYLFPVIFLKKQSP